MMYGLVVNGTIVRNHDFGDDTPPVYANAAKGVWLPIVQTEDQVTDAVLQRRGTPVTTIGQNEITIHSGVRLIDAVEAEQIRQNKLARISDKFKELTFAPITIECSVDQVERQFDADEVARTRIHVMVTLINAPNTTIPNPRNWTAYQQLLPCQLAHDDFRTLAGEIVMREDTLFGIKKTKEGTIKSYNVNTEAGRESIAEFDTESGW
jgi:hypothetical protein